MQPDYQHFFEHIAPINRIRYQGDQGKGTCPLGTHTDLNPSFSFHIGSGQCQCFSCQWKGNAYTLAKMLDLANPEAYLSEDSSYIKSSYIPPNKPKKKVLDSLTVSMNRYHSRMSEKYLSRFPRMSQMKAGRKDDGTACFPYFDEKNNLLGLKTHKKHWEGDGTLKIYGLNLLKDYKKDKLLITEGEPDMLVAPMQSICFSAGAGSIPKDLSPILDFKTIFICYDNDDAGVSGAAKVAQRIKESNRAIKVMICQWSETLPVGYDIKDDYVETEHRNNGYHYDAFDESIKNAIEYKLPSKGYEVMSTETLMRDYTEPPKPIVKYLLYEGGVALVAGTDGVGKTWFVLQMAHAIATGQSFLDFEVNKKPVLLIQFELSREQLSERLRAMRPNFADYDFAPIPGLTVAVFKDDDMLFTDQWNKIRDTVNDLNFKDGVIIVDNIYTSTGNDISNNHDLQPILGMIQNIKQTTGNSIVLVGHHNKNTSDEEPLLTKGLIHGGKHLTNYVHNVIQIGESTLGVDLRRAKITKVRDEHCELNNEPFKLHWEREKVMFERGVVITNEKVHCIQTGKKWELQLMSELYKYANGKDFDKQRIWSFVQAEEGWMPTDYNYRVKLSRYLSTMIKWGFIERLEKNHYRFNKEEIEQYISEE